HRAAGRPGDRQGRRWRIVAGWRRGIRCARAEWAGDTRAACAPPAAVPPARRALVRAALQPRRRAGERGAELRAERRAAARRSRLQPRRTATHWFLAAAAHADRGSIARTLSVLLGVA